MTKQVKDRLTGGIITIVVGVATALIITAFADASKLKQDCKTINQEIQYIKSDKANNSDVMVIKNDIKYIKQGIEEIKRDIK